MALRSILFVVGLVVVAGAGVVGYRSTGDDGSFDARANVPIVSAKGGMWKAYDLSWREFDGAWAIKTTMAPFRVSLENAPYHELMRSFCGSLLTALPEKPAAVTGRNDVFRVELNIVDRGKDPNALVFEGHMPVTVRDGACQVPQKEKFTLFPTYPGALVGWRLEKVSLHNGSDGDFAEVVFFWTDPGEASHDGFAYLTACKAAMADPYVLAAFKNLSKNKPEYSLDTATQIKVSAKHRYGSRFLNVAKGGHVMFDLVNGTCARPTDSEDA